MNLKKIKRPFSAGNEPKRARKVQIKSYKKPPNGPVGKRVIEVIKETTDRSSIHGFPSLSAKPVHWIIKIMWLVFIISSWGYLIYQINNSLDLYYKKGVVSSTSIVYEAPTDFFGKL